MEFAGENRRKILRVFGWETAVGEFEADDLAVLRYPMTANQSILDSVVRTLNRNPDMQAPQTQDNPLQLLTALILDEDHLATVWLNSEAHTSAARTMLVLSSFGAMVVGQK